MTHHEMMAELERNPPREAPHDWPRDEHGWPLAVPDPNDPDDDYDPLTVEQQAAVDAYFARHGSLYRRSIWDAPIRTRHPA